MTALICAVTAPLKAEERGVSLQEIIDFARENNGELKSLREEAGIGEASKIRASLSPNPVLDLEGTTGSLTGSESKNRLSIGVSQEFLIGGKREKRLAVAESELAGFGSRVKDAERLLLLAIKTEFHDLFLAEGRLDLAHKSQELNNKLLQITQKLLEAGDIAELDVNLVKVEVARDEGRILEAERELVPARQRLLALMGAAPLENLKIASPPEAQPFAMNLAELKSLALTCRPDLQTATSEKSKGEAALVLAQAERLPNVTGGVAFSRDSEITSFPGVDERSTDYLIDLKLSVPIPFFDRNQAAIKEAQARKSSATSRHLFVRQSVAREVEAAHARVVTAEKSLSVYDKEIFPQLMKNLQLVQEAYRLGEVGILAMLEEQKKFAEVNDDYLVALHARNTALAKLEAAVAVELSERDGGNK